MRNHRMVLFLLFVAVCALIFLKPDLAHAGNKTPSVKENKITIYLNDSTYQIECINTKSNAKVLYQSSDQKVIKVDTKGRIQAVSVGEANVKVTINQEGKNYTSKISVRVRNSYIFITNKISKLSVGDTYEFELKEVGLKDTDIVWWVSNPYLATVRFFTGKFTAINPGRVKVTAKDRNSGKTSISYIDIERAEEDFAITNPIKEFWCDIDYKFQTNSTSAVSWTTSDEDIAFVDQEGVFVAKKIGTVVVTAKDLISGKIYHCELTIKDLEETPAEAFRIEYDENNDGYVIQGLTSDSHTDIRIPETIHGIKVVGISNEAFYENSIIRVMMIPSTVQYSGNDAYYGCMNLESIIVLNRDNRLGIIDARNCRNLKEFIAPYICEILYADYAFANNTNLRTVIIPEGVKDLGSATFNYCENMHIVIPSTVKTLELTFSNSRNLTVEIPETVMEVESAIMSSHNLTVITKKGSPADLQIKAHNEFLLSKIKLIYK